MATRIQLKRSETPNSIPTTSDLRDKEVALNIADRKLYVNNNGTVVEVANQKPNTGEVTTSMLATDITDGPGNTYYVGKNGADTTTLANSGGGGLHWDTAFLTLKKNTLVLYYMSDIYKKNKGIGIRYNDPKLNLKWPVKPKIISVRDNNFTNLQ